MIIGKTGRKAFTGSTPYYVPAEFAVHGEKVTEVQSILYQYPTIQYNQMKNHSLVITDFDYHKSLSGFCKNNISLCYNQHLPITDSTVLLAG